MIRVSIPGTRLPESLKLANKIASFCFEQQYGELELFSETQKEKLRNCQKMLAEMAAKLRK